MKRPFPYIHISEKNRFTLLLLCVCCMVGLLLGGLANGRVADDGHEALRSYLQLYLDNASQSSVTGAAVISTIFLYVRYPVLLYLLGLIGLGVYLIPLACAMQSFFLSFSVCGFASALGRGGVMLAFAALGIRCFITLPCIFLMALLAMDSSRKLKQQRKPYRRKRYFFSDYSVKFAFCLPVLSAGIWLELTVVPRLLCLVLEKII